ncbi:MAG TPA: M20/M25/M40 family metallo-hydrolase, partial [Myxococcaceae bacterium]|nr:M20/M25/M40 family metallo-hydrolase [Myxococcaceae bacterium]
MTRSSHLQTLLGRLNALVAADTRNPGGSEEVLARALYPNLERLRPDALVLETLPGGHAYLFARWGAPRILINAHLDTVPSGDGWTGHPLQLRVQAERAVGLGAADTKGSIAALLTALDRARPHDRAVLLSGDEEGASRCMEAFLASPHSRGVGAAVVCEPTGCRAGTGHRGILAFEVEVAGTGGHSSRADTLPAPLLEAARVAAALGAWGRGRNLCLNVAEMRGGVAYNVVPPGATLVVSVRPSAGSSLAAVRAELEAQVTRALPGAVCRWTLAQPPFSTSRLSEFRNGLGAAACEAPLQMGFWT